MSDARQVRVERDFLGSLEVPADALYGIHTARAVANFEIGGPTLADRPELLEAYVRVKIAAARANADVGALPAPVAEAIVDAGREVLTGMFRDQFPVALVQGGGGTATNMNVNEVLANRAEIRLGGIPGAHALVHPNDHVNRSQSTNDTYPTALQVATRVAGRGTITGLARVARTLREKGAEYADVERLGRTCLRDGLPIPISAGHDGQAHAVERTSRDLASALDALRAVPLGATLVGTGAGAPPDYRDRAVAYLADETGFEIEPTEDPFDSLAHLDPLLGVASALTRAMLVLGKIASDLRFLASGPVAGIGEVTLPAVQAGSSQVPGKVNPVLPEFVLQIGYEIRGATHTIEAAVAAGELELNIMEPVVARHLIESLVEAGRVAEIFAERCLAGLAWNEDTIAAHLAGSAEDVLARAADTGYEAAAEATTQPSPTVRDDDAGAPTSD